ncbi:MAG: sulfur carrier protein ThiS [Natronospirillum sp.]|uniref:sulfur carrier protein ThiS n=1 Tax=Natronospirillum sp. TaxID=2812955 RepID=UPI0025E6E780|nr:sulfur carrier protein ThiS [Natronospirillum sp.]MCH8550525.1 sulfur carrier protein ThiS [Natronospirillum sp.]
MKTEQQTTITVTVQGKVRYLAAGQSLSEVLTALGLISPDGKATGLALAVNQEVVPASDWPLRSISDGDYIQLFQAIAGG